MKAMHQLKGSHSALEKWQLGMERLAKSQSEPALLGLAMSSIHGALEDQFRHILASLPRISQTERFRVYDLNQVKWRELRDLMQKYLGLSDHDAKYIMQMNAMRNEAAHGGEFRGSYQDIVAYSEFVKKWLDVTEKEWLDRAGTWLDVTEVRTTQVSHSFGNRCPRCQSMNVKSLEVIYHRGITVVEHGKGKVQTKQSGLSLQAAPPQKKKYIPRLGAQGFLLGFFLFAFSGLLLLLVPIWFYIVWKFNTTEYPRLMKEWRRTFKCEQCGYTFPLETSR